METKKAYGIVTALGTKLGERARSEAEILDRIRAAPDIAAFRALVQELASGLVPPALVASFLTDVLTEADWVQWRSRLLLQMKLTRDGKARVPGHETGRGVGRP